MSGFIGDPIDGIGYIDLSGFANDAGREVRYAIRALQHGSSQIAASDSDARDESGLVATDPTKLKVSCIFPFTFKLFRIAKFSTAFI
jgi:C-terminal processing protease CtpA/Prc